MSFNYAGRVERLKEIRQWGTTRAAEKLALEIVAALPDDIQPFGIFATEVDEDTEQGDGGIRFVRYTDDGAVIIEVTGAALFEDCHCIDGDDWTDLEPQSAQEAAAFLAYAGVVS